MELKGIRRILDIYETKTKTMENCTDYYLYDKANDTLVRFDNGDIIFYGDKDEAEKDCYGNECIVQYKDLNKDHKLKIRV